MTPRGVHEPDSRTDAETPCDRLDEIIADYLDAQERGVAPPRAQLLADHPDLADELDEFLRDQELLNAVVAPLVGRSSQGGIRVITALPAGQKVGRYELLEELGRGGMGVVYKARQPGVNRHVALKMIGAGPWATPADLERFRLEASVIAQLDHPHIVPLYEVGEDEGRPYYSMKWIEGGSLAQRIEKFKGRSREAARLLLQVARAIEHAHQHGVLHRDLKPGNILIGADDSPHVTDFGLAKRFTAQEPSDGIRTTPAAPTLSGTALGTPSYMAPEQARNARATTTAADIYSLGAILYECLTGRPPFRSATNVETLLDVLNRDPQPPGKVKPGIDSDMDTICLKCLQKEPEQRYSSAAALADDLQRYLNREPILARPVGRLVRLTRWCRRQPVVALLSLAVVVSIVTGMALVFVEWQRAEDEAENALREREFAVKALAEKETQRKLSEESFQQAWEVVDRFCFGLSEEKLSQYPGFQTLRVELLEQGLKHYQTFLKRNADDPRLKEKVARTYRSIAQVNVGLGRRKEALAAYLEAKVHYTALLREDPDNVEKQRQLAELHSNIGGQHNALGNVGEAQESLREARKILDRLIECHPDDQKILRSLVMVRSNENGLKGDTQRPKPTPPGEEENLRLRRKLVEKSPESARRKLELATELRNVALSRFSTGKEKEGVEALEESRSLLEGLLKADPTNDDYKAGLAHAMRYLGHRHSDRNQFPEAMALNARARELLEEAVAANPDVADYKHLLGAVYADIGNCLNRQGKGSSALGEYQRALTIQKEIVEKLPDVGQHRMGLAQTYYNMGNVQRKAGRLPEALKQYREAETHYRLLVNKTPENLVYTSQLAGALNNMADVYQQLDRREETLKSFEEAVKVQRSAFDRAQHSTAFRRELGMYLRNLSRAYRLEKRPMEALQYTLELRKLYSEDSNELARILPDFLRAAQLWTRDAPEHRMALDQGVETLAMLLAAGYRDHDKLRKDPDLKLLRERDEFERLLKSHAPK